MTASMTQEEPIPHWPGEFVTLDGGHQVYVRGIPKTPDRTEEQARNERAQNEQALFVHGLAGTGSPT